MDKATAEEFAKRCKYLKALGVEYRQEHEYRPEKPPRKAYPLRLFSTVKPPFTPHEWLALCVKEGQFYVGGCCGNMSAVQDEVSYVLRFDSGWFDCKKKLEGVVEAMAVHDGGELFKALPAPLDKCVRDARSSLRKIAKSRRLGKKAYDPWKLLALIWHIVKDFYAPERPHPEARVTNTTRSALDDAVSDLGRHLYSISIEHAFSGAAGKDGDEVRNHANCLVRLARILPALKTLNEHIDRLDPGPIEGFALVRRASPDDVLVNGRGLCVFGTEDEAQKLIKLWVQEDEEYESEGPKQKAEDFAIRKVKVTKEKGVEFQGA
jgi:hypothetical protein